MDICQRLYMNSSAMAIEAAREITRLRSILNDDVTVTVSTETTESAVQQQLRADAALMGGSLWRNNNGACFDKSGRLIRYGLGNDSKKLNEIWKSSDLIGIAPGGKFLAVEVKSPGWKLQKGDKRAQAQLKFLRSVSALGGLSGFATSSKDLQDIIHETT